MGSVCCQWGAVTEKLLPWPGLELGTSHNHWILILCFSSSTPHIYRHQRTLIWHMHMHTHACTYVYTLTQGHAPMDEHAKDTHTSMCILATTAAITLHLMNVTQNLFIHWQLHITIATPCPFACSLSVQHSTTIATPVSCLVCVSTFSLASHLSFLPNIIYCVLPSVWSLGIGRLQCHAQGCRRWAAGDDQVPVSYVWGKGP